MRNQKDLIKTKKLFGNRFKMRTVRGERGGTGRGEGREQEESKQNDCQSDDDDDNNDIITSIVSTIPFG